MLDVPDRRLIAQRRGNVNRLGFAVQLCTVRFVGAFVPVPAGVPGVVVSFVAGELGVDAGLFARYGSRSKTLLEHQWDIRKALGLVEFRDAEAGLREFLSARAWTRPERPSDLFDHAVVWLRNAKVLLPGVTVLERLIAEVRTQADNDLHDTIAGRVDAALLARLDVLLEAPPPGRLSRLEYLRRSPRQVLGRQLALAMQRVIDIRDVGAHLVDLADIPEGRLDALARGGLAADVASLRRLPARRRAATMVAVVASLRVSATDDALDVFSTFMADKVIRPAERVSERNRLQGWDALATASATLASTGRLLLDLIADHDDETDPIDDATSWQRLLSSIHPDELAAAVQVAGEVAPPQARDRNTSVRAGMASKYRTVTQFLGVFADNVPFDATDVARPVLEALRRVGHATDEPAARHNVIDAVVTAAWRPFVFDPDKDGYDHGAYVLCVLEALHDAMRRRDVYVVGGRKWGDPRARLLHGRSWTRVRPRMLTALGLSDDPTRHLDDLARRIDNGFVQLADRLHAEDTPAWLSVEADGRARLHLEQLEAIPKPASLIELDRVVAAMLSRVDLPELLMDVHARTGFLDEFHHYAQNDPRTAARLDDLAVSLAAVFIAEGCNLGYGPLTKPGHPALTRSRLSHVNQNYVRADTIAAANARLIDAQAAIPTAQIWGGGHVASVDGLRFVVPVRTLDAGPNPRYFGHRRGVTWLNAINDQIAGIGAVAVTGTSRDSLHVLDIILHRDGGPNPEIVTTDTAGYSDIVFGLFRILGYQFSPRLRDLPEQRLWRFPNGRLDLDDTDLAGLPIHRLNPRRIINQWPDMLRVAGSLQAGVVNSHDLVRMLNRGGNPSPLGAAFADYGRAAKTLHILSMTEPDDTRRRVVSQQLSSHEGRHRVARKLFHGQRGELRQPYRVGQEDQLGVLGLFLNAVVLWNTIYIDAIIAQRRHEGHDVDDLDVARVSPLKDEHINVHGRYTIITPEPGAPLRPLRDPNAPTDE